MSAEEQVTHEIYNFLPTGQLLKFEHYKITVI